MVFDFILTVVAALENLPAVHASVESNNTLLIAYKKRSKNETSPFLSNFRWCHCSIYDFTVSLLLNKASKIELVVSCKAFLINHTE